MAKALPSVTKVKADPAKTQKARELRESAPHAVVAGSHSRGQGRPTQVVFPQKTFDELRDEAHKARTSIRAVILQALKKAGYTVPTEELADRRKR